VRRELVISIGIHCPCAFLKPFWNCTVFFTEAELYLKGKRLLGKPRPKREDVIKMDIPQRNGES
jgi:hypothetical protein